MDKKTIVEYIEESPHNTNRAILNQMLDEYGGKSVTGTVQADWAENDSTAEGYVKNRTHSAIIRENMVLIDNAKCSWVGGSGEGTVEGDIAPVEVIGGELYIEIKDKEGKIINSGRLYGDINWDYYYWAGWSGDLEIESCDPRDRTDSLGCYIKYQKNEASNKVLFTIRLNDQGLKDIVYGQTYDFYITIKETCKQYTQKLDENYIPDTIARTSQIQETAVPDWNQSNPRSKDYIKNRPCFTDPQGTIYDYQLQFYPDLQKPQTEQWVDEFAPSHFQIESYEFEQGDIIVLTLDGEVIEMPLIFSEFGGPPRAYNKKLTTTFEYGYDFETETEYQYLYFQHRNKVTDEDQSYVSNITVGVRRQNEEVIHILFGPQDVEFNIDYPENEILRSYWYVYGGPSSDEDEKNARHYMEGDRIWFQVDDGRKEYLDVQIEVDEEWLYTTYYATTPDYYIKLGFWVPPQYQGGDYFTDGISVRPLREITSDTQPYEARIRVGITSWITQPLDRNLLPPDVMYADQIPDWDVSSPDYVGYIKNKPFGIIPEHERDLFRQTITTYWGRTTLYLSDLLLTEDTTYLVSFDWFWGECTIWKDDSGLMCLGNGIFIDQENLGDPEVPFCLRQYYIHNTERWELYYPRALPFQQGYVTDFVIFEIVPEELKTLDEQFIPDTIARKEEIMILNSSTEGSTKKFKITVNDDGVLSAVEI